jgi:hypothetical protein
MQRLKSLAGYRKAGFAAAIVMAGGLAGSVLLTPGTALATTGPVATVTNIAVTQQADPSGGTTLDIWASASATSGSVAPSGTVDIKIFGGKSCVATLGAPSANSLTTAGNCYTYGLRNGNYGVSGSYAGGSGFTGSNSATDWITIGSSNGGSPHGYQNGQISTSLNCPASVTSGRKGTCTLSVTNDDSYGRNQGSATGVTAQITLPASLRAGYCDNNGTWSGSGQPYPWSPWTTTGQACSLSGNVVTADLGTLSPGQTRTLSVTFSAHLSSSGWYRSHRLRVTVSGSAHSTTSKWGWNGQDSSSSAHVTIYPRGW